MSEFFNTWNGGPKLPHRGFTQVLALTFLIALAVSVTARADTITAVDLASVSYPSGDDMGSLIPGTLLATSSSFFRGGSIINAYLTSGVYLNTAGVYTYVLSLKPLTSGFTSFSTGYVPTLFNNVAGWDFNAAPAGSFTITLDQTGLSWSGDLSSNSQGIRLFFQTTVGGGLTTKSYNLGPGQQGLESASGFGPNNPSSVPEESALLDLCVFGLVLAAFLVVGRVGSQRRTANQEA
jgi:hypothetical protein